MWPLSREFLYEREIFAVIKVIVAHDSEIVCAFVFTTIYSSSSPTTTTTKIEPKKCIHFNQWIHFSKYKFSYTLVCLCEHHFSRSFTHSLATGVCVHLSHKPVLCLFLIIFLLRAAPFRSIFPVDRSCCH